MINNTDSSWEGPSAAQPMMMSLDQHSQGKRLQGGTWASKRITHSQKTHWHYDYVFLLTKRSQIPQ